MHPALGTHHSPGAALGERGREGTALEHSALGSTPHGPEDKPPFSKHKLPGEQHACAPRPLHHHRESQAQTDTSTFSITILPDDYRERNYLAK